MSHLYCLNTEHLSWQQLLPQLPRDRQARILSCRQEDDRRRCAGAGWLLQWSLTQHGIAPSQQQFVQNPFGKPFLGDRDDLFFSLSHSGPWVVCATASEPVGVDVDCRCPESVARRHFHPQELTTDPDQLLRIWTAKEAFLKALGTGLTRPLDSFVVRLTEDGAALEQTHSPLPYRLHEYVLSSYRVCLCSTDEKPEPEYVTITE